MLKTIVTCPITEVTIIIETQEEIVKSAVKSNLNCQCKTEGRALRITPLLQEFAYCADNKENVNVSQNQTHVIPPGTDQYARKFIKALVIHNSI